MIHQASNLMNDTRCTFDGVYLASFSTKDDLYLLSVFVRRLLQIEKILVMKHFFACFCEDNSSRLVQIERACCTVVIRILLVLSEAEVIPVKSGNLSVSKMLL